MNETHLILGDLHTDVEELTVCLYISVVAASDLVLAGEGRVRQIVGAQVGRPDLGPDQRAQQPWNWEILVIWIDENRECSKCTNIYMLGCKQISRVFCMGKLRLAPIQFWSDQTDQNADERREWTFLWLSGSIHSFNLTLSIGEISKGVIILLWPLLTFPYKQNGDMKIVPCPVHLTYHSAEWPSDNDELIVAKQMQIFALKKSIGRPGGSDGKSLTINHSSFNTPDCLNPSGIAITRHTWPYAQTNGNQEVLCQ